MPGLMDMLGTVTVGLFYRQLVSRVPTTAGQDSPGRGLLQTGSQNLACCRGRSEPTTNGSLET